MIRKGEEQLQEGMMEHQLQQNNICGVWKGLKTISGFKEPKSQPVGDQGWGAPSPLHPPLMTFSSHPPDTSSSHSVLRPSPPSTPPCSSLLLTSHQVRNVEEEQGQESSRSGWHQLQAPEVLRRPAVWDFWVHIQPEPEAGESATTLEDVLHRPSAKDTAPQGAQQLQAGSSDVSSDEDAGETGPRPSVSAQLVSSFMDPLQFVYHPDIGVDDAVIYLLHFSLTHLEKAGSTVRIMALSRIGFSAAPVLRRERFWLLSCSPLYTADFSYNTPSCHLQKFSDDSAVVGLITDGDDREYRGLIQDFADWCLRNNLQINTSKTKELVVDFRRRSHSPPAPVSIQGTDIDTVKSYKYLGVHLNDSLDWSDNT
ncbi:hypothetical protein L3Q82_018337 [Scortum barcoo]|uniref:Uncharacterized protein n=1 Tax=Scortum barcoo TaxID=214431 RepID=A0ACB8VJ49_9TELE|nr:hypothetical protein L3Q82_018337 [Scortum barcoo]